MKSMNDDDDVVLEKVNEFQYLRSTLSVKFDCSRDCNKNNKGKITAFPLFLKSK